MTTHDTANRFDVAIAGSGFAGSILARILARQGSRVLLIERWEHPRFALGESSTPLGAILLETLAERYRLPDLADLAAYGRWTRRLGHLGRGLKRGFTFYGHRPGLEWTPGPANENRLLVAASPNDEVADAHWLRADVDAHLVELAVAAGVDYRDRTRVTRLEQREDGWMLGGEGRDGRFAAEAEFLVDASGRRGVAVENGLAQPLASTGSPETSLVYAHLAGVPDFASQLRRRPPGSPAGQLEPGPYPDDKAAIHHLIEEGWIYVLPFDDGVASAGLVLEAPAVGPPPAVDDPEALWRRVLERYPTLARQMGGAEAIIGWHGADCLPHRLDRAAGDRWLALPSTYAFFDPMFSTGIAWSLAGVERIASLFEQGQRPEPAAVERYAAVLAGEADHLARLIRGAYQSRRDFRRFAAFTQVYFAAAAFQEAGRRLNPSFTDWTWEGFLGAGDPVISGALAGALERLAEPAPTGSGEAFEQWIGAAIAPRNLAGLADPSRRNLYPVDLQALVRASALLGLSRDEVEAALPRLRGQRASPAAT